MISLLSHYTHQHSMVQATARLRRQGLYEALLIGWYHQKTWPDWIFRFRMVSVSFYYVLLFFFSGISSLKGVLQIGSNSHSFGFTWDMSVWNLWNLSDESTFGGRSTAW